jgi:hypothetical protein
MANKRSPKKRRSVPKTVLRLPDLDQAKSAVLNSLSSMPPPTGPVSEQHHRARPSRDQAASERQARVSRWLLAYVAGTVMRTSENQEPYVLPALLGLTKLRGTIRTAATKLFSLAGGASHNRTVADDWAIGTLAKWCT